MRKGVTRIVLVTGRWAIKVPNPRPYGEGLAGMLWGLCRGVLANQAEATWWRNATPDMRPHLCPVLRSWLGGLVQVYPRCDPFEVDDAMREKMWTHQYSPVPLEPQPGDTKPENFGVLDGRVVLLDYDMNWNGCPHDRSGAFNRLYEDHPEAAPYEDQLVAYRNRALRGQARLAKLMDWCAVYLGNSLVHRRIREFLEVPDDAYPWQKPYTDELLLTCEEVHGAR